MTYIVSHTIYIDMCNQYRVSITCGNDTKETKKISVIIIHSKTYINISLIVVMVFSDKKLI